MKANKKLLPGQPGTKKLLEKDGEKLACVRYRYDDLKNKRIKTVELIEEEVAWNKLLFNNCETCSNNYKVGKQIVP